MDSNKRPKLVEWKYFDTAILTDEDGAIVHNSFQQDDAVTREGWDDGAYRFRSVRTGKILRPVFRFDENRNIIYLPEDDYRNDPLYPVELPNTEPRLRRDVME